MKGNIEKRGPQVYRIRLDAGRDEKGRRVQRSVTVHGSKRDAERKLSELLQHANAGGIQQSCSMTVSDYMDYWLHHYVCTLSVSTQMDYRKVARLYVRPNIGRLLLRDVKPSHLQSLYAKLKATASSRTGKAISDTAVAHVHAVLSGAFRRAVGWRLIDFNPAKGVVAPQPAKSVKPVMSRESLSLLLEHLEGGEAGPRGLWVLLALSTGFRRGEVCGLRWQDVDMEKRVVRMVESTVSGPDGPIAKPGGKTPSARRSVVIPEYLVAAMERERRRQDDIRAALGPSWNTEGLVVVNSMGRRVDPTRVYDAHRSILRKLGLPHIALHGLRHSHATWLLEQNVHPKVVSERLGHSKTSITLDIYSHVLQGMQEEAARKMDDILKGVTRKEEHHG